MNDIITMRCLTLLFYNFKQEDITNLRKESQEFDYLWSDLLLLAKNKKWSSIPDKEFYDLFVKANYKTQGEIIKRAKWRYLPEATHGVYAGLNDLEFFKNISDG